jgi:hypothetical protein
MDEGTQSYLLAAAQGFGLLGLGTFGVLFVSGLVCALLDLTARAIF